jgi:hypothetical protein
MPTSPSHRRQRGGQRSIRAQRSADRTARISAALQQLVDARASLASEHDPEGIWGMSADGVRACELAEQELHALAEDTPAAGHAAQLVGLFLDERHADGGYVSGKAELLLTGAIDAIS